MFRRESERAMNKENGAGMNCGNIVEASSRASVRSESGRVQRTQTPHKRAAL
jgi:hypothetical protein